MQRSRRRTLRGGRLSEQVVSEIERLIAAEYPRPGQRLPTEAELSGRFGVSRIVVREAMKILEDRGLVEVRAGRGTCTISPSPQKVKESLSRLFRDQPIPAAGEMECMLELRGVLEESAAALAAVRATPEDLESLRDALAGMASGPEDQIVEADLRFHRALASAAHNRYYEMVLEPLTEVFVQQIKLADSYSVGLPLHTAIYAAIEARNPAAARKSVRRLMRATMEDILRALQALTDPASAAG